ncbi:NERD domain-containing protein [Arsenicicoccus dermatophilus]|uniref:nuclease-related domain-containing protein n=1 Tax=Arsenicicoccus dermatophilus TaxID=1076331 RepID=UPI0039171618
MVVIPISDPPVDSERRVAQALQDRPGAKPIQGVLLVGPLKPAHVDLLVLTPHGCVVVEVKGVLGDTGGLVEAPLQGDWTAGGASMDLCLKDGDVNPIGQAEGYAKQLGGMLRDHPTTPLPSAFVPALIVVTQPGRSTAPTLRLPPPGFLGFADDRHQVTVVAHRPYVAGVGGDRSANVGPLRGYFHGLGGNGRSRDWDLESVATFFDIIDLPAEKRPDEQALRAEGFKPRPFVRASVAEERPSRTRPLPVQPVEPTQPVQPVEKAQPAHPVETAQPATQPFAPLAPHVQESAAWPFPPAASHPDPVPTWEPAWTYAPVPPAPPAHAVRGCRGCLGIGLLGRGCLLLALLLVLTVMVLPLGAWLWQHASTLAGSSLHPPALAPAALTMPSGNITCWDTGSGVRCTIVEHDYRAPAPPAACRAANAWGRTVELTHTRAAALTCPPATPAPRGAVLPYGQSRVLGTATCRSTTSYVECTDGPHGLRLARADYRVW